MRCEIVLNEEFPVDEFRNSLEVEHAGYYGRGSGCYVIDPGFASLAGLLIDGDMLTWKVWCGFHSRNDTPSTKGAAFPSEGFGWMKSSGSWLWVNTTHDNPVMTLCGRRHAIQGVLQHLGIDYQKTMEEHCLQVIWYESWREDLQPWKTADEAEAVV